MKTTMLPVEHVEHSYVPAHRSHRSHHSHHSHRGRFGRFGRTLAGMEVALCVAALGGAVQLITSPHDAMPADVLTRTPFSSWVIPGILLALSVAVPAGLVAYGALTHRPYAHVGHPLVGLALMGWIVMQVVVIGPNSWLQPVMFGWGLAILLLGASNYRR